jgi:hypothetical protein
MQHKHWKTPIQTCTRQNATCFKSNAVIRQFAHPSTTSQSFFLRRRRSTAKAAQLEDRLLNPTAFRRRVGGRRPPTRGLVPHAYRSLSSSSSLHCQQLELLDHCSLAHATARLSSHGYAIYLYTISVCLFTTNVETFHACFGVRAGETTVAMRRADGAGDLRSRCLFGKEVIFWWYRTDQGASFAGKSSRVFYVCLTTHPK